MLDLRISKGLLFTRTGKLDCGIHSKHSNQCAALSSLSMHLPSTHSSWPSSRIQHSAACCSNTKEFRKACSVLFRRLRSFDVGHPALITVALSIAHGRPSSEAKPVRKSRQAECSRIIIPYHPLWSILDRTVASFAARFTAEDFSRYTPCISWSKASRNLHNLVLAATRFKLGT